MNILLLQFNNYSNRRIKFYSNVEDYISRASNSQYSLNNKNEVATVNFAPNDGIETILNINWNEKWNPDYLLVLEENTNKIVSRWFVNDHKNLSKINFDFNLKRDVIADRYAKIINSPCFIEKGFVASNNPLIFNKEDFFCNQIKKNEVLLKDKSNCSWIVIYYNLSQKANLKGDVSTTTEPYVTIGTSKNEFPIYAAYKTNGYHRSYNKRFGVTVDSAGTPLETFVTFNKDGSVNLEGTHQSESELEYNNNYIETQKAIKECINSNKTQILQKLALHGNENDTFEDFYKWNNVLVKATDNNYYRIKITKETESVRNEETLVSGDLFDAMSAAFKTGGVFKSGWSGNFNNAFYFINYYESYKIDMILETNAVKTYHYDFSTTDVPSDASYGIIAMPFKPFDDNYKVYIDDVSEGYDDGQLNSEIPILIAQELCSLGMGANQTIYDVQILPYCPLVNFADNAYTFGAQIRFSFVVHENFDYDLGKDITFIYETSGTHPVDCISVHPSSCKFTFDIPYSYNVEDYKVVNQCDFVRLCSPNWNGIFEFNPAKNDGVQSFNVDCTYKPYQPYIHINPNFKGLYGKDFNDARGLICGGDFSLGFVSSAWETYKINNKNYQEIFNRQIENMDTNYKIQQTFTMAKGLTGTVLGAGAGIVGGALGHPAAAAGGIMGATGSFSSGLINLLENSQRHAEARDYAIDIHNYQLDNIKALPSSLSKVDSFNNNNKIFPILEEYSCTDEEKEIFKDKIKYEGMTVNAIGKIIDYIGNEETFVKGKIIRLNDLDEDNHYAQEVIKEIALGLYFEKGE